MVSACVPAHFIWPVKRMECLGVWTAATMCYANWTASQPRPSTLASMNVQHILFGCLPEANGWFLLH